MRIDRPFFDKFNNSTYIHDIKELGKSILNEIYNILSTRIKSHINTNQFNGTNTNPFDYGIIDLQSVNNIKQLSDNIRHSIMMYESRIKECYIENISINQKKQSIELSILFTIDQYSECFQSSINIRY